MSFCTCYYKPMETGEDAERTEIVREALHHLFDQTALVSSRLADALLERGLLADRGGLYPLLLAAIGKMKPPNEAPPHSSGWRLHRYLQLRYVACYTHESVAEDLGISLRHAARIHQSALETLAGLLMPTGSGPPARASGSGPRDGAGRSTPGQAALRRPTDRGGPRPPDGGRSSPQLGLEAELATVGRLPPDGAVDVSKVADDVCGVLRSIASSRGMEVRAEGSDDLPPVRINRVALRQILLNLLLYTMEPSRRPDGLPNVVTLRSCRASDAIAIQVLREGSAAGNRDQRWSAASKSLLSAAQYLAQLQGARLEGIGGDHTDSGLCLWLPVSAARTVLVVDDNPEMGVLFQRLLDRSPYRPIHVRTVARALALARENPPDVIILDIVMPQYDGWEAQAALGRDPHTSGTPVIVCSVLPDRDLALSLGAVGFLAKPVTRAALLGVLEGLFVPG